MYQSDFQIERAVLIMIYENLREGNSGAFRGDGESFQNKGYIYIYPYIYIYMERNRSKIKQLRNLGEWGRGNSLYCFEAFL